ncbi:MAG: hypothetical protein OQL09_03020 [Gammaproteobacteria bacterium]|nr:hypothetical protein [Gammaproteobacteria bacterium]
MKERTEIDGFAELDEILILSFKDAVNCKPVASAKVQIGELDYETDALGYIKLPMAPFSQMMDARAPIKISKQGYITLNTQLEVAAGTVLNRRMVLSPALAEGKVRFVLQWDEEPEDLDLHLTGPDLHISYRNMRNVRNRAKLDQDEMQGYGPETITLDKLDLNSAYTLWVDNYSNDNRFLGTEQVYVYSADQLVQSIRLIRTRSRAIKVLQINNGEFIFLNQPSARP